MAGYINDEFLEEVREKNDIVDVVSQYIPLKQKGNKYWGCCPFHGEKTPSFCVNADEQYYYCFGCHVSGNVIHFIMNYERCDYHEGVELLANRVGMQMPPDKKTAQQTDGGFKEQLYEVGRLSALFFYKNLRSSAGAQALKYLRGRGLSDSTITKFGLGYSLDRWDALKTYLLENGCSEKAMLEFGVLNQKDNRTYDAFRNRVMYPIIDSRKRVIGFGGRVMDKTLPKYINSRETPVFQKGRNLYGLNHLKGSGRIDQLLIVEGYMDVISVYQQGFPHVVASLGTALTQQQAMILKRYCPDIYVAYDGDSAGQHATLRGIDILTQAGLNVNIVSFPDGMDPDDFARAYGLAGIQEAMSKAKTYLEYKISSLEKQFDLTQQNERIRFVSTACRDILSKIDSPVERSVFVRNLGYKTGIAEQAIEEELEGYRAETHPSEHPSSVIRRRKSGFRGEDKQPDAVTPAARHAERVLIRRMAMNPESISEIRAMITSEDFHSDALANLAEVIFNRDTAKRQMDCAAIMDDLDEKKTEIFAQILSDDTLDYQNDRMYRDCLKQVCLEKMQLKIQELSTKLTTLPEGLGKNDLKREHVKLMMEYNFLKTKDNQKEGGETYVSQ